jgi:hypothetical protein
MAVDDDPIEVGDPYHLRRREGDEEAGIAYKNETCHLMRTISNTSHRSLRRTVDPSVALPNQYRSV